MGTHSQVPQLPRSVITMSQAVLCKAYKWTSIRSTLRSQTAKVSHRVCLSTQSPRHHPTADTFCRSISTVVPVSNPNSLSRQLRTLSQTRKMASASIPDRYKLIFFVPPSDLEACKEAIFATGAGSFPGGKYTKCCFQTNGTGQFLPSQDANPAIGAVGTLEQCDEVKAEIMCLGRDVMLNAVAALIKAHPYEEVAYEVYRMENV